MRITVGDVRAAGVSLSYAKIFFLDNNLDWEHFLRNGVDIPVELLSRIPEPFSSRLISEAMRDSLA